MAEGLASPALLLSAHLGPCTGTCVPCARGPELLCLGPGLTFLSLPRAAAACPRAQRSGTDAACIAPLLAIIAARCAAKRVPAKARLPSARAACLACAPLRLTDTSGPAQTSETSQTARELSAPVGGRALGLRSQGSWLAAELCAPGSSPAQLTAVQVGRASARPARTAFNSAGLEPGAQQLSCKPAIL